MDDLGFHWVKAKFQLNWGGSFICTRLSLHKLFKLKLITQLRKWVFTAAWLLNGNLPIESMWDPCFNSSELGFACCIYLFSTSSQKQPLDFFGTVNARPLARDLFVAYARSAYSCYKIRCSIHLHFWKALSEVTWDKICPFLFHLFVCRCYKHEFLKDFFLSTGQLQVGWVYEFYFVNHWNSKLYQSFFFII